MLFLSPLFLWGLLAASVPVIIHLINRRRHQTVQWAAMQFLLKATRESRGKRKLRNILILACRCLAIAGLIIAAARPVVSGLMGWGGGSIETVVLLLDRSASMEARPGDGLKSRRELILDKVREAIGDLGNPRLVLIDSASNKALEVSSPEVLAELSSAGATDTQADIPGLLAKAAEFLTDVTGRSEIWLASDLQASNWNPKDEAWVAAKASLSTMPREPRLRVLSLTGDSAPNVSVKLLSTARSGDNLSLQVEVLRYGKQRGPISIPLSINFNGVSTTESLTVADQSLMFQKNIRLPQGTESGYGWLSVPADGNVRDNAAFFAYGPSREIKALVVSAPGESASYLTLTAAPPGMEGLKVTSVNPEQAPAALSPDLAAVLWAAPLPTGATADALKRFLSAGGQVMFLPPGSASSTKFIDFEWSAVTEAETGKFFILADWNHADGLLRDGLDGVPLAASRLKAIRRQLPLGELTALARWEDGEPALARRIVDSGTAWFLGSIPDYTWSNLGDADVLLPAVQRMLIAGAQRFDQAYQASLGTEANRLLGDGPHRRIDNYNTPSAGNLLHEAGIFEQEGRLLAVNRPAAEDIPDILTQDELFAALEGIQYTYFDQSAQADDPSISNDVWRAFMVAALLFLLAEAMLCLPKKTATVVLPAPAKI